MGMQKVTTRDLFRTLGKTERTRSAKADSVFRQLRQGLQPSNSPANATPQEPSPSSFSGNHTLTSMLKTPSRHTA